MEIQNPIATQIIRDAAKLQIADQFPKNLLPNVQAVMDMTPDFHLEETTFANSSTASGTVIAYTGRANFRLVITGFQFSYAKDATCDATSGSLPLSCTVGGRTITLAAPAVLTLTAEKGEVNVQLKNPIVTDAATNVSQAKTFTVGALARSFVIRGYEIQQKN